MLKLPFKELQTFHLWNQLGKQWWIST